MIRLLINKQFWLALAIVAMDGMFFTMTNPSKVVSIVLMVGFLLLSLTLYFFLGRLLSLTSLYGISLGRHRKRLAFFATGIAAGLLALQSMGELSTKDALVAVPLALVLYFYLSYRQTGQEI
jgi:hypothetical protein